MPDSPILLLDLDGTLVDSAPDLAAALNRLMVEAGASPFTTFEVAGLVGEGARRLVEKALVLRELSLDASAATARFLQHYKSVLTSETRPYPGVIETLHLLRDRGWHTAVCTNKPEAFSRAILENLALSNLFEELAGGDTFPTRKPDPAPLLALVERLGGTPGAAVMVGDGVHDLLAAKAAGIPAILASYGYGSAEAAALPHAAAIKSFGELPEALGQL